VADTFPEYLCAYARRLAAKSPAFARQCYNPRRPLPDLKLYSADPFGECGRFGVCKGVKQRFPDRVLVMTSTSCFMNCRHCTRRGLLETAETVETQAELAAAVEYVKSRPAVRDVLLSGGDVLTLKDEAVLRLVRAFASLGQVDIVRVCTRALAVNPRRVTEKLASALGGCRKVWVNTQFNCADEVTPEAMRAARRLIGAGVPVSCQSVLLKGVNDTGPRMLRLLQALSAAKIRPYYVFLCDPVPGIEHFRVSLEKALEIERYCAERIGGLSLPRFVADVPGAKRKIPIESLRAYQEKG
jgi:lysine 2,3-aminomutase